MIITCIIAHTPIQAEMFAREMGWFHSRDCRIITHPDQLRGLNKALVFLLDGWHRNRTDRDINDFRYALIHPHIVAVEINSDRLI